MLVLKNFQLKLVNNCEISKESKPTENFLELLSNKESPYKCNFSLETNIKIKDKLQISFEMLINFDADGSYLEIIIDDKLIKNIDFVELLKNAKQKDRYFKIKLLLNNLGLNSEENKIKLDFKTVLVDAPFKIQIKKLSIKNRSWFF